jgi:hypothetical protein
MPRSVLWSSPNQSPTHLRRSLACSFLPLVTRPTCVAHSSLLPITRYVAIVKYGCCKSRSGYCTYCIFCKCQRYVANVCLKCFIYFRHMLQQVFYLDVAYVSHICFKCLSRCCIYFTHMLRVFYLDVTIVCFKYFICVRHMLHPSVSYYKYLSHPFLRTKIECIKDSCAPQDMIAHTSRQIT